MATQQSIPNFEMAGFYYFDALRDLLRYMRINVTELTSSRDVDPHIQLTRAWALAHHYMNTRLDIVANETLLPTARLLESVRSQLKLIDYKLDQATPGQTELVMHFSSLFTSSTLIVPKNSQFATESTDDQDQIIFEAVGDNQISRTDQLTNVFTKHSIEITLSNKSGNLFDYSASLVPAEGDLIIQDGVYAIVSEVVDGDTIRLNSGTGISNGTARLSTANFGANKAGEAFTSGLTFQFGLTNPEPGDELYLIHDSVMWDQVKIAVTQDYRTGITGVWEFYDGSLEDENPDIVTNLGPNLRFDLTTLLGEEDRSGTKITISYAQTSATEQAVSKFVSGKNVVETTGLLGQVTPSTTTTDYTVGTVWHPVNIESNSAESDGQFSQDGTLVFELPQSLKQNWAKTTINGKQGFALRFRVQSLDQQAAQFTGTDFNSIGLDSNNYKLKLGFDGFADLEFDVTGDLGANPGSYAVADIAANINTAMTGVDASLSGVASVVSGQLKLLAPDQTLGKDSEIRISAPSSKDATNELFGLSESSHPFTYNGVGGPAVIDLLRIDEGNQYLLFDVVQGETVEETPLASSDGVPDQAFVLTHTPLIDGTLEIYVDEGAGFTLYDEVDNFLASDQTSKVYTLDITAADVATLKFGDGSNGKIPPAGVDNIKAVYRIGADQDGNVGAETISVNLAGISFVNRIWNPRRATGWATKEGSTEESLAKAKIQGPASLRTLGKAITPGDIEDLAEQFVSPTTGSKPVIRSKSIEETFGIKTIELLVVGTGGALLNETQRDEIDEYFNGNKTLKVDGVLVSNHEVTTVNYTPKEIDIEVEVEGGNEESIKNALIALISPEAVFDDGVTYRWDFSGKVPTSLIIAAIHDTDQNLVKNVNLIQPAADVVLGARELPIIGNLQVTVV